MRFREVDALLQTFQRFLDSEKGVLQIVGDHMDHGGPLLFRLRQLLATLGEFLLQLLAVAFHFGFRSAQFFEHPVEREGQYSDLVF